ncbi:hypothetical protein D3C84_1080140 [compost metagenome]
MPLSHRYFPEAFIDAGLQPIEALLGEPVKGLQADVACFEPTLFEHSTRIRLP